MTHQRNTLPLESPTHHLRRSYRSILEYLGMVVAMFAGMTVLDPVRGVVAPEFVLRADLEAVVMATEMVIGMATWMVARRHDRRGIAVMSAVMYLPFLLLAPFFWGGVISGSALSTVGHLLMLPVMALAMPLTHRTAQRRARAPMTAAPSLDSVAPSPLPERAHWQRNDVDARPARPQEVTTSTTRCGDASSGLSLHAGNEGRGSVGAL